MLSLNDHVITKSTPIHTVDFQKGGILLIDKPIGWTSFDVVNKLRFKIRHALDIKKIKVGHAGTLDPNATGLLLVCTGKLTKVIDSLQAQEKVYSGHFYLGQTTPTYDSESEVDATFPITHIDEALLKNAAAALTGNLMQMPPVYSAIKINGKKAYDLARKGKDVEMKARPVQIHEFDITSVLLPEVGFLVRCSKGTYIRSLAFDLGKALNSGAHLSSLRRESIGNFKIQDAFTMDEMVAFIESASPDQTPDK